MKQTLLFILAAAVAFSLCGCGSGALKQSASLPELHIIEYDASLDTLEDEDGADAFMEVRAAALSTDTPVQFPIAENKRIQQYKAKFAA